MNEQGFPQLPAEASTPRPEAATVAPMLLTVPEVAHALHVGRSTVYELMARGLLESITVGRARRIPLDAVTACIERLRSAA